MKKIKVAIIGCGRVAGHHAKAIDKLPGMKLTAACDLIEDRVNNLARLYGVPAYSNYHDMLVNHPEIDVVAIITPSGMHYEHARDVIKNYNKNVIIEKPMVLKFSHGKALANLALKHKVKVFPVFQYRFNKPVQRVKRAIIDRELGDIFLATIRLRWCRAQKYYDRDRWRGTFTLDGGACTNQGIHHLDLLRYLVGEVTRVNARMSTFGAKIEVEDTVTATLEFQNKAFGLVEITTAARPVDYESSISILGSKGIAIIGGWSTGELIRFSPDPNEEKIHSADFPDAYGFGHEDIYNGVYNYLVNSGRPAVEFDDAMNTIKLLHTIYFSDEINNWANTKLARGSSRLGRSNEELAQIYRTQKRAKKANS